MFVNSFIISVFILLYFGYISIFHSPIIKKTYENCCKLSVTQIGSLIFLAFLTVLSSLLFFNMEKYVNTPFINNVMMKAFSLIMLFLVGFFIFEEKYNPSHLLGVGLTLAGMIVLMYNPI